MSELMRALQISRIGPVGQGSPPLEMVNVARPTPGPGEVLIRVHVCAICHTELDEIEGRTPPPSLPMIPGHQVVGTVEAHGPDTVTPAMGTRVGVAWIFHACGRCHFCLSGRENLCPDFLATGRDRPGGYAEYMTAPAEFAYPIPDSLADDQAAPLLCAGAIGLRSLKLSQLENGQTLGLTGFGGSNHLVLKAARNLYPDGRILVWARNPDERQLALKLGATWAGDTDDTPPVLADAIIDTTPVYRTVLAALRYLAPGGRLVINAIRKETHDAELLAGLDYESQLWHEKEIKTVANVTRQDVSDFLELAARLCIRPETQTYSFGEANYALQELKTGRIHGAKVLQIG